MTQAPSKVKAGLEAAREGLLDLEQTVKTQNTDLEEQAKSTLQLQNQCDRVEKQNKELTAKVEQRDRDLERDRQTEDVNSNEKILKLQSTYDKQILRLQSHFELQIRDLSAKVEALVQGGFTFMPNSTIDYAPGRSLSAGAFPARDEVYHIDLQTKRDKPIRTLSQEGLIPALNSGDSNTPAKPETKRGVHWEDKQKHDCDSSIDGDPPTKRQKRSSGRTQLPQNDGSAEVPAYADENSESHTMSSEDSNKRYDHDNDLDVRDMTGLARTLGDRIDIPNTTLAKKAISMLEAKGTAPKRQTNPQAMIDLLKDFTDFPHSIKIPRERLGAEQPARSQSFQLDQTNAPREDGASPTLTLFVTPPTLPTADTSDMDGALDRGAESRLRVRAGLRKTRKAMADE